MLEQDKLKKYAFFMIGASMALFSACAHTPGQFVTPKQKVALKHEQMGNQYYDRGRAEDALREWQVALDLDPDRQDLRRRISTVEGGKTWDSQAEVESIPDKGMQEKVNQAIKQAEHYYRMSQLKDAEVTWRHALTLETTNTEALAGLERLEAEMYQRDSKRSFDRMTEDLYMQGMQYYRKADWEKAFIKLSEAANLNPEQPQVKKYLESVKQQEAMLNSRQAITQSVQAAKHAEERATWLEAYGLWKKVLAIDTENTDALLGVKRTRDQLKKWAVRKNRDAGKALAAGRNGDAQKMYREVLEVFPDDGEASRGLKNARQTQRQTHQTASQKDQARESFNRGVAHYRQGQLEQAIAVWETAVQEDPEDEEYQDWLGRAKKELAGMREQNKQQAQITYQDGLAAYQRGELNKAYLLWKETLELDPEHPKAKANMKKIKKEME